MTMSVARNNICVIGLGYVGLTLAVAMAEAGFRVFGVEKSEAIRECVNAGRAHFTEVGLDDALARHVASGHITCDGDLPAPGEANVYVVTVGTPLTRDGAVNLASIEEVLAGIANRLLDNDLVILRSTVKVGVTRGIAKRILDTSGKGYLLAFCPERTLEGKALQELTSLPQVVGGLGQRDIAVAASIFSRLSPKIIKVDSLEAAEMVKLINNTQRDLMFAFANEVAEMCDAAGVSAMQVIGAACEDYPRSKIPLPGPVGGPCLEKDPHILAEGLREVGYVPRLSLAGRRLNEELPRSSISRVSKLLTSLGVNDLSDAKIVILGLAFKGQPATSDVRGTMASHILEAARARWPFASYTAFDPVVPAEDFARFGVDRVESLEEAFAGASLVFIQNNHRVFAEMPLDSLAATMATPGLVYDYWNLFSAKSIALPASRHYAGLGTSAALSLSTDAQTGSHFYRREARG